MGDIKKIIYGLCLVLLMMLAFGGVKDTSAITIEYWHGHTGPDGRVMDELVAEFCKQNPDIKVQITVIAWAELFTKVLLAVKSGAGPDVVTMPLDRMIIYKDAAFKPIDDLIAGRLSGEGIDPDLWKGGILDGKRYGIPLDTHPYVMYYRKDLFEKAGLAPLPVEKPLGKEEFLKLAKTLTKDGQWGFGFKQTAHHLWWDYWSFFIQEGGQLFDEGGKRCLLNEPSGAKAMQFLWDLQNTYKVTSPEMMDWKTMFTLFKEGKIAMIIHGSWLIPGLDEANVPYMVAPLPHTGAVRYGAFANVHLWAFTRLDKEREKAALKMVEWVMTPKNSARWGIVSGNVPALLEGRKEYAKIERNKALVTVAKEIKGRYFMTPYHVKGETIQYKVIIPNLESIIRGKIGIKAGLDLIVSEANAILEGK